MAIFQSRRTLSGDATAPPAQPVPGGAPAPAGGGGGNGNGSPDPSTTAASDVKVSPNTLLILGAVAALFVFYWVAFGLSESRWDPEELDAPAKLAEGVGLFGLIYLFAQAIERLLEPLSWWVLPTADLTKKRDVKVAEAEQASGQAKAAKAKEAADAQAELDRQRANRSVAFWAIASIIGIFTAASTKLYLLRIVGVGTAPRWAELLATGLVIGAGTKPVHDLVQRLQTASKQADDPAQTGGS